MLCRRKNQRKRYILNTLCGYSSLLFYATQVIIPPSPTQRHIKWRDFETSLPIFTAISPRSDTASEAGIETTEELIMSDVDDVIGPSDLHRVQVLSPELTQKAKADVPTKIPSSSGKTEILANGTKANEKSASTKVESILPSKIPKPKNSQFIPPVPVGYIPFRFPSSLLSILGKKSISGNKSTTGN